MGKKTGELIRSARTGAKLTQAALGAAVGLTAADIGKAERGEKELTQAALKAIAKATGVTQASLLNAEKTAKPASKTEAGTMKLSASERTLIKLFRAANDNQKSDVLRILNGEKTEVEQLVDSLLGPKWKKKAKIR